MSERELQQNRLRVTHVVLSLDCGGLERVVLNLIEQGRLLGQVVSVVCLERPGDLASQAELQGARVLCLNKQPGLQFGLFGQLKSLFRQTRPEVVHSHQMGPLLYAGWAATAVGVPLVVHTEHGKHFAGRRRAQWLGWLAGRHAARYFCVSRDVADEVRHCGIVPPGKVHLLPNGISLRNLPGRDAGEAVRRSLGIPPGVPVIGTVGRLSEIKRQDLLLRAFARLPQADAHLVLVGDGPRRGELEQLSRQLGLSGRVHFAGYQAQPEVYLSALDVFALTSRSEGMPLAVLEAWAARLPVLASRVGGLPEMIRHGDNGLLFPSGDELALTQALASVLADPNLARRLGEAGRSEVESRYEVGRMAREYQRHYRELLGVRRRSA